MTVLVVTSVIEVRDDRTGGDLCNRSKMTALVVTSVIEVRDDRTRGDLCYRSKK